MGEGTDLCFPERRRFPRYPCMGDAELFQGGKSWGWGRVNDISRCGCYIETSYPLPVGTLAQLRLTLAEITLDITANVVSTTPQVGMGMDFVVDSPERWDKLAQIVEKIAAPEPSAVPQDQTKRDETQPYMQAALQYLQQAQDALKQAVHDEEGHSARALQLTENAINEVTKAWKQEGSMETTHPASMGSGAHRGEGSFNLSG